MHTTLQRTNKSHPEKRLGPLSIGATNDGYEVFPQLHITDKTTSLIFFVDIDADISLLPLSGIKKAVAIRSIRCQYEAKTYG